LEVQDEHEEDSKAGEVGETKPKVVESICQLNQKLGWIKAEIAVM
jgi:hypothetical protein